MDHVRTMSLIQIVHWDAEWAFDVSSPFFMHLHLLVWFAFLPCRVCVCLCVSTLFVHGFGEYHVLFIQRHVCPPANRGQLFSSFRRFMQPTALCGTMGETHHSANGPTFRTTKHRHSRPIFIDSSSSPYNSSFFFFSLSILSFFLSFILLIKTKSILIPLTSNTLFLIYSQIKNREFVHWLHIDFYLSPKLTFYNKKQKLQCWNWLFTGGQQNSRASVWTTEQQIPEQRRIPTNTTMSTASLTTPPLTNCWISTTKSTRSRGDSSTDTLTKQKRPLSRWNLPCKYALFSSASLPDPHPKKKKRKNLTFF